MDVDTLQDRSEGTLPDGKFSEFTGRISFSNNGKIQTLAGPGTVDGEKTDNQRDIYRKVSE